MTVVEQSPPRIYSDSVIPKLPLLPLKKGWAKGTRATLLGCQLQVYSSKRTTNTKKAVEWANSQAVNEYFTDFHWRLSLDQEPQPDDLPFLPDDNLSEEEREWKAAVIKQMSTAISNWLDYHWGKGDSAATMSKKQAANDPIVSYLSRLAGIDMNSRQRALTAEQLFGKDNQGISDAFNQQWKESGRDGKARAGARTVFVASEFAKLSTAEKKMWKARAAEDAEMVKKSKEATLKAPTLLPPEEAQKAMDSLAWMMGPLLDGLVTMLGCHVSLIITGPEPRKGGQINVLTLHHGYDKSPVPLRFHEAGGERGKERYKMFLAAIGDYIATCYSKFTLNLHALPDVSPPNKPPSFLRWDVPWNLPPGDGIDATEKAAPTAGASRAEGLKPGTKKTKKKGKGKKQARAEGGESENEEPPKKKTGSGRATKTVTLERTEDAAVRDTRSSQRHMLEDITNEAVTSDVAVPPSNDIRLTNTIGPSVLTPEDFASIDPSLLVQGVIPGLFIPNCGPNDTPNPFNRQPSIPSSPDDGVPGTPPGSDTVPLPQELHSTKGISVKKRSWPPLTPAEESLLMGEEIACPPWLRAAKEYLARFELGKDWDLAIAKLTELEEKYDYLPSRKPLPRIDRPSQVDLWIQNARGRDPTPITNRAAFTSAWWSWWRNLQPAWRELEGKGPMGPECRVQDQGDWSGLIRPGQNGLYSVVASLDWWGDAVGRNSDAREEWRMAIDDVNWVMDCIVRSG
ncbi:hypothetical protein ARMSODRAFT_1016070 [Armillaria solidipes]|uniref:Uncharacterized protein n=1 Tax=Armillaria solidipes TaxID=1076256 RepID=A0A2H3BT26_9AGAR|nr:hypothetical protein ARMSODRAFT_1016070 [Armillaria solidipes]